MTHQPNNTMTMREAMARAICADGGGFCQNIGGDLGCKCGRGETPHWSKCIATPDQLLLSGNFAAADAVLAAMREATSGMIEAGEKVLGPDGMGDLAACFSAMIDAAKNGA